MNEAAILSLEWEKRVTGGANKYEEEEDSQVVEKTAIELYEQTDIIDEQVGWRVVEIITGA